MARMCRYKVAWRVDERMIMVGRVVERGDSRHCFSLSSYPHTPPPLEEGDVDCL